MIKYDEPSVLITRLTGEIEPDNSKEISNQNFDTASNDVLSNETLNMDFDVNITQANTNSYTGTDLNLNCTHTNEEMGENNETQKRTNNTITFYHQNIPYIEKKIDLIEVGISDINPDIIVLTEHGLKFGQIGILKLAGYKLISIYCRSKKSGGSALLVKEILKSEEITKYKPIAEDFHFEPVIGTITFESYKLVIIGVYRSPSVQEARFISLLESLLDKVFRDYGNNHKILLVGDFNIDSKADNFVGSELYTLLNTYNLINLVSDYTRITTSTQSSIDYVITNLEELVTECSVVSTNKNISDHKGQVLKFFGNSNPVERVFKKTRRLKSENIDKLNQGLSQLNWNIISNRDHTAEENWSLFCKIMKNLLDQTCPTKDLEIKNTLKNKIKLSNTTITHKKLRNEAY